MNRGIRQFPATLTLISCAHCWRAGHAEATQRETDECAIADDEVIHYVDAHQAAGFEELFGQFHVRVTRFRI